MSCTILNIIICWSTLIRTDLHTKKFVYESMLFETTLITLFPVNLQTKLHISAIRYNKHAWKLFPETIVNCTLCASASYGGVSWFGGCVAYRSQRGGRKVWHAKNRLQNPHISTFSTSFSWIRTSSFCMPLVKIVVRLQEIQKHAFKVKI